MDDSDAEYNDSYASSSRASEVDFSEADYSSLNEAEPTRRKVRSLLWENDSCRMGHS